MAGNKICMSEAEKIPASGENKKWGVLEWVTAGSVLATRFLFYIFVNMPQIFPDSNSYLTLTWKKFLQGGRMPLYPLIIQINRLLFRDGYLTGVIGCQIMVSLISVLYLYRAIRLATGNRRAACIVVFFYGGNLWIANYDAIILTESFAISISVFLLYNTVCYIRSHSYRSGVSMVICVLLAVLEKSALFVYVPAFLIFLAIQFFSVKEIKRTVQRLFVMLLGIVLMLLLYSGVVWLTAGTFSVDNRGPWHMMVACLESGLYKNYPDRELVEKMEDIYLETQKAGLPVTRANSIVHLFGDTLREHNLGMKEFNNYCLRSDFGVYLKYLGQRFVKAAARKYELDRSDLEKNSETFRKVYRILSKISPAVRFTYIYLIDGAAFILLIVKWRRKKECPWYYLGAAGMISVIMVSVMVGTFNDYDRCTSYVLPFAFFGLALLLNDLIVMIGKLQGIKYKRSK